MVVEPRPPSVSLFTILLNIFISYKAFYRVSIILYFFLTNLDMKMMTRRAGTRLTSYLITITESSWSELQLEEGGGLCFVIISRDKLN